MGDRRRGERFRVRARSPSSHRHPALPLLLRTQTAAGTSVASFLLFFLRMALIAASDLLCRPPLYGMSHKHVDVLRIMAIFIAPLIFTLDNIFDRLQFKFIALNFLSLAFLRKIAFVVACAIF